jgi:hypothetical protein
MAYASTVAKEAAIQMEEQSRRSTNIKTWSDSRLQMSGTATHGACRLLCGSSEHTTVDGDASFH